MRFERIETVADSRGCESYRDYHFLMVKRSYSMSTSKDLLDQMLPAVPITESGDDTLQRFLDANKIYHFEGDGGLKNLTLICETLGYRESGFRWGTPIEQFLSDNPGAQEKIIEFIGEWVDRNDEWKEALTTDDEEGCAARSCRLLRGQGLPLHRPW